MDEMDKKAIAKMRELGFNKTSVDRWEQNIDRYFDFPSEEQVVDWYRTFGKKVETEENCRDFFMWATS